MGLATAPVVRPKIVIMNRSIQISKYIEAPPQSSFVSTLIVLFVVAIFSIVLAVPGAIEKWTVAVLAGLLLLAIILRADYGIHIALFVFLFLLLVDLVPLFEIWPLSILVPLALYGIVVRIIPQLRHYVGWMHMGSINSKVIKLVIATVCASVLALIGWVILVNPDMEHHLAFISELPYWAYPFVGVGFAIFNASMEEIIFRGIFMEALDSALGSDYRSVCVQAIPFAALHYLAGFPNGALGFIMVLIYGILLGAIRRKSRGMLAPLVAHVMADITIFAILAFIILQHKVETIA
ncbi:MAG: CPBP family intramembrane glutamic endopeptidase [Thermodesulfobacteriota bacterium]|nr:CPBP family intramembrane glutamic endopeptidase [Thermodesulfobacteriota bacterium]